MPLTPGKRLGPYEVLAPLGAGGMGEVYRARDTRLGREVALKILPAEVANDPSRRQRFELEARAVAALNHPNIVAVFDVGHGDGSPSYMVTELVDGESLRDAKFSLRKTLDIAVQIAGGLAAAHDAGIVHRDLKPDNILLTRDGRVKILDFGLAKVYSTQPAATGATVTLTVHTEPGVVMGTAGYMSPEQVRGLPTDHRSDIFSFGVILYELLVGKRAFPGETSVDTMQAILRQDPLELPETVPATVRQIVARCLEKDPVNRFQSARDLGFALTQSGSQSGGVAALKGAARRPRRGWIAIAAVLAGLGGAIAGAFLRQTPANPNWTGVLLGGPEIAMSPRLSPDGHTLAFRTMTNGETQVAVMKPDSGNWTILTHKRDSGSVNYLDWSHDGSRIYYDRIADVPMGIFSVPVLGGEEQPILEDGQFPTALPDGSLLLIKSNAERKSQLFRFWPETGRLLALPLEPRTRNTQYSVWSVRVFPGGREALVLGTPIPHNRADEIHLYILDLATSHVRRLPTPFPDESLIEGIAIARDGANILIAGLAGNVTRIVQMPTNGSSPAKSLLTLTAEVSGLDAGADGRIYLDQLDHRLSILRFPAAGGHAEKIATFPAAQPSAFAKLADGRAVVADSFGGRLKLMAVEAGKDPVPLVNTTEETADPVTAAGPREVAFLIGPEPRRTIAMATVSNGRIVRRIPFDKGTIYSLASSPDGATLYCAAGGNIWSLDTGGGAPRRIRAGDSVAMEPGGEKLLVQVSDPPRTRWLEAPLNGGAERTIPLNGPLYPSGSPITNSGIGKDGRMVTPLVSLESWFFLPGIIDLNTGKTTTIPTDHFGDYNWLSWSPDGQILAAAFDLRSTIWKFTPEGQR